jgi:IstB-like ATP binding protein
MRLRDHPNLTRQHRTNMLQSVAITVGVGKSHVAQALGHLAIRQGAEVRFYKTSRVLAPSPAVTPIGPDPNASPKSPDHTC